uniref:Permease n=1 Tax=Solibacter usitatus (strain Ellin6076) TaxID=234267 RepID=Q02D62_SOLUE
MSFLLRDVLYGVRLLRRSPAFTSLAAAIIALGIGAATAIFSLLYGVVLNALPFHDADHLMAIWSDFSKGGGNRRAYTAPADYFDWKERSRSFTGMTAYRSTNRTFTALDQPVTPLAQEVPADYFDVLGVTALRGRTFVAGEDRSAPGSVAVISYALWQSLFDGSDDVIGKSVELDGRAVQLVGVLPPGFRMPNNSVLTPPDLWIPTSFDAQRLERVQRSLVAFGRLKPGVSPAQAEAELAAISEQIAREHSQIKAAPRAWALPIREDMIGEFRGAFLLLLGAVGIMLLIACANVANLLLARATGRAGEVALRTALGASRADILKQMLTESALLALLGGAAGILVAQFSIGPLLALIPAAAGLPFAENVQINLPVLAFAMALSLLTAVFFGLAPARQALNANLIESLKEGGRSRTGGREGARWRNALIVVEVGLSIVLLTGAGLMTQTFWRLSHLNLGFDAGRVLNVRNSLRGETYATPEARRNHFATAAAKLATIPGVESVSAVSFPPPLDPIAPTHFTLAGDASDSGRDYTAHLLVILPRYFETVRNPLLSGRGITEADSADSLRVAVVTKELARRYFADRDPVGRSIRLSGALAGDWRIVGIAADIACSGNHPEPQPIVYVPHAQAPVATMSFLLRTRVAPATLGPVAERTLWSTGRLMNVYRIMPLEQVVEAGRWQNRFTMILLTLFAALALILAAAGIYAVISFLTLQRTREIGIRMALGARPVDVLRMVTRQGVALAAAGVAFGMIASLAAGRVLASRLYGVAATDPLTLAGGSVLLLLVAAAASTGPAMRAASVAPADALRRD